MIEEVGSWLLDLGDQSTCGCGKSQEPRAKSQELGPYDRRNAGNSYG